MGTWSFFGPGAQWKQQITVGEAAGALLSLCESQGLNPGHQRWLQAPLSMEPPHLPPLVFYDCSMEEEEASYLHIPGSANSLRLPPNV